MINYQAYKSRKIPSINRKSRIKTELQVKAMVELANKVVKMTKNILHLFMEVKENMNMVGREVENKTKVSDSARRDGKYNIRLKNNPNGINNRRDAMNLRQ